MQSACYIDRVLLKHLKCMHIWLTVSVPLYQYVDIMHVRNASTLPTITTSTHVYKPLFVAEQSKKYIESNHKAVWNATDACCIPEYVLRISKDVAS